MKVYDITSKLENEKPVVRIGEKDFEINNSKNAMIKVNEICKNSTDDFEIINEVLEELLGKGNAEIIEAMNLSVTGYKAVFIAVLAGAGDEEYEEVEKRFQKSE